MTSISVFGGSQSGPGEDIYTQANHLGSLLGLSGYTVLTGGYIGTMEAVSRGANEAGGHVIGVTCEEIEAFRPGKANPWVIEEMHFVTLRERIFALISECDAALALPGGPGTLTEISMAWNHLLIGALPPRPLILIGQDWRTVFETFYDLMGVYVPAEQRRWLSFAPDVDTAFAQLQKELARQTE
jgi:uncharacterized protein (TIGR00725 family)